MFLISPITSSSITYRVDQRQNLNPHNIAQIQILSPAVCPNETRAMFTVFGSSNGWGSVTEATQVLDEIVNMCVDSSQVKSCALICEGFPDGAPWVAVVVAVMAIVGFTVPTGIFFCGGDLISLTLGGLCLWGFWVLVSLVRVSVLILE